MFMQNDNHPRYLKVPVDYSSKMKKEFEELYIPTGSTLLDTFLGGGIENGAVTAIYGPGGSGKTNICLLALARMAGRGKKTIYIDTASNLSIERLRQITNHSAKVLDKVVRVTPESFDEQDQTIKNIQHMVTKRVGLVIVDAFSPLYRLEYRKSQERALTTRLLRQMAYLIKCARSNNIPIIITNDVFRDLERKKTEIIGGRKLKNLCRCIIELEQEKQRHMHLKKHPTLSERSVDFQITKRGIEPTVP
jgi:DNA repair protein RadB